jgi:hypothetical protein
MVVPHTRSFIWHDYTGRRVSGGSVLTYMTPAGKGIRIPSSSKLMEHLLLICYLPNMTGNGKVK